MARPLGSGRERDNTAPYSVIIIFTHVCKAASAVVGVCAADDPAPMTCKLCVITCLFQSVIHVKQKLEQMNTPCIPIQEEWSESLFDPLHWELPATASCCLVDYTDISALDTLPTGCNRWSKTKCEQAQCVEHDDNSRPFVNRHRRSNPKTENRRGNQQGNNAQAEPQVLSND